MTWLWLTQEAVLAFHEQQLAEHGGGSGIRDPGLLESALSRPANAAGYGTPDVFDLAAAYAFGIAKNHPFVDGNKRAAFGSAVAFLIINGHVLKTSEAEAAVQMVGLASGAISEQEFAVWLRSNSRKT